MTENRRAVFGIFAARSNCERAVNELVACGLSPADFSVLPPEPIASPMGSSNDAENRAERVNGASPGASPAATLAGLGISASKAAICENRLRNGGVLFCVYCNSAREREGVKEILTRNGVEEIEEASEARIAKKEREVEKGAAGAQ